MAAAIPAQSRTFAYDNLDRMTARTEPEGTTTWVYDNTTAGNLGKGRLHTESKGDFLRKYTYGAGNYGRVTAIRTTIGGVVYDEGKAYDTNGNVASETYPASPGLPGGFVVEYAYNGLGYLERVQAPGGSQVYYQTVDTTASGQMLEEWMGDGSTITQTYEGVSGRITNQLSQTTATVQDFTYTYDASGNMLTRDDDLQSLTETFSYDDLDRLTSAQVTGQTAVQYAFDAAGSITQKSDVADTYDYLGAQKHAVTLVTLSGANRSLNYDANGNFASGTSEPTITWSSFNKPTQLTKGPITYNFDYGPDRKRYRKQKAGVSTHYIGALFEKKR